MTADEQVEAVTQVLGEALAPSLYEALMEATHDSWRQWRFLTPQAREKHRAHAAEMVAESLAPTLLASPAFRAIVAAERAAALREAAEADRCGGCKGEGAHRRNCPRHPTYHPWKPLADRAESVGDSIGVPELANQAWALAGAIREAMPDHPYRNAHDRMTP